jgi:hypothetical protein
VKEKQVSHLKAVIALQDKLKGNQHRVNWKNLVLLGAFDYLRYIFTDD